MEKSEKKTCVFPTTIGSSTISITLDPDHRRSTPSLLPVPSPFPRRLLRLLPLGHRVILHRQGRQCRRWTRKKEGKSEGRVCLRRVCFYPVPLETLQCFAGLRGEQVSMISVLTLRFPPIPRHSISLSFFLHFQIPDSSKPSITINRIRFSSSSLKTVIYVIPGSRFVGHVSNDLPPD